MAGPSAEQLINSRCANITEKFGTLHDAMEILEEDSPSNKSYTVLGQLLRQLHVSPIDQLARCILWFNFDFSMHRALADSDKGIAMRAIPVQSNHRDSVHDAHTELYAGYRNETLSWGTLTDLFNGDSALRTCVLLLFEDGQHYEPLNQLRDSTWFRMGEMSIMYRSNNDEYIYEKHGEQLQLVEDIFQREHKSFAPYLMWLRRYATEDGADIAAYLGYRVPYEPASTILWSAIADCGRTQLREWVQATDVLYSRYHAKLRDDLLKATQDKIQSAVVYVHCDKAIRDSYRDDLNACDVNGVPRVRAEQIRLSQMTELRAELLLHYLSTVEVWSSSLAVDVKYLSYDGEAKPVPTTDVAAVKLLAKLCANRVDNDPECKHKAKYDDIIGYAISRNAADSGTKDESRVRQRIKKINDFLSRAAVDDSAVMARSKDGKRPLYSRVPFVKAGIDIDVVVCP